MSTKALQQSYIGRVIWTPKYVESKRPFLSFSIHIDNHAFGLDKKKTSAKIQCNYTLPDNAAEDEVGVILSRITTKDEPDSRGLAGQQYKSVEVLVEGTEKLQEVEGKKGAYYKTLEYCRVTVLDNNLRNLFRQEMGQGKDTDQSQTTETSYSEPERPKSNVATRAVESPTTSPTVPSQPEKHPKSTWEIGAEVVHGSKTFKFIGGNPNDTSNWKELTPISKPEPELPPFMVAPGKRSTILKTFIEEDSDMEFTPSSESPV